jgi:signal transduction histidine kinase
MDDRGTLTLRTDAPDEDHIRVRIVDSGPGVPAELLELIFEMDFTTKIGQRQFGMGMGLPICRQIVNRHGGSITLSSRPGETTATVILPVRYRRLPREWRRS